MFDSYKTAVDDLASTFPKALNKKIKSLSPELHLYIQTQCAGDSFSEKVWNWVHGNSSVPLCENCHISPKKWISVTQGYKPTCSIKCHHQLLSSRGEHPLQNSENRALSKQSLKNVDWSARNEKSKQAFQKKYNVDSFSQTPEFRQKIKENHHMKTSDSKDRLKATVRSRYGVDCVFQNDMIKEKSSKTTEERYGKRHYSETVEWKNKVVDTSIKKYGVEYPTQRIEHKEHMAKLWECDEYRHNIKTAYQSTCLEKYGMVHASTKNRIEKRASTKKMNKFFEFFDHETVLPNFELENYKGVEHPHEWKCLSCGHEFDGKAKGGVNCPKCNVNSLEQFIIDILDRYEINYRLHDRELISPLEIDILLPEHLVAIEVNGSYWHTEQMGKDKNYHSNKSKRCEESGWRLIHIWEHDIISRPHLVENLIAHSVKKNQKIAARKTRVVQLTSKRAKEFFKNNHWQGSAPSSIQYGLIFEDELVAAMSFGSPRFSKKYDFEMIRFSTKCGTAVVGGASKLFKHFIKAHEPQSVISYCDLSRNTGKGYEQMGFEFQGVSAPNYWYTKDYLNFHSRIKFQKHKLGRVLETFDPNMTEVENMLENGYSRIWDCGNSIWVWKPNNK
jgi:G:T-mismatch repair DNA endonuclease (very short patch repair protein)